MDTTFIYSFRTFLYSFWLPVAIVVISIVRFIHLDAMDNQILENFFDPRRLALLVFLTWPCGMPLTSALRRLFRRSRTVTYILAVILVPLSAYFALYGGLFGPFGVVTYSISASIPAWIVLGIYAFFERRQE